jgi:hypothetical protein
MVRAKRTNRAQSPKPFDSIVVESPDTVPSVLPEIPSRNTGQSERWRVIVPVRGFGIRGGFGS